MTIRELITKFSGEAPTVNELIESVHRLHCDCRIGSIDVSQEIEAEPDLGLNGRERISINLQSNDGVVATYRPSDDRGWGQFIQAVKDNDAEENARLIIDIRKTVQEGKLSIYNTEDFAEYLEVRGVEAVLKELDEVFEGNNRLTFEVQDVEHVAWNTQGIAVVPINSTIPEMTQIELADLYVKHKKICDSNVELNHLVPSMFMPQNEVDANNRLQTVFLKYAKILCFYYLFDQLYFGRNELTYRMIGLKAINGTIDVTDLRNATIDSSSLAVYASICDWLYNGGNIYDKACIARNVLSLNINENSLSISARTHDAVVSNFKIYEMENMKHYINARNKASEEVSRIQKEILRAIDDYTSGFTKVMTANLTFFLTTVIIRVLAKNIGSKVLLPNEILYLSYALLLISLLYLSYSRYDAQERMALNENHFALLRNRYNDLLGDVELANLSSDFNKSSKGTTAYYVDKRMKWVTWLWGISLSVIAIVVTVILVLNLL